MAQTGHQVERSHHQLLSTVAWTTTQEQPYYALEGAMFTTGACIQWLRDGLLCGKKRLNEGRIGLYN